MTRYAHSFDQSSKNIFIRSALGLAWTVCVRILPLTVKLHAMEYMLMSQKGKSKTEPALTFSREEINEEVEQSDKEKLMAIRAEYEKYKELWGLNLQYSHSAGAANNYSRLDV